MTSNQEKVTNIFNFNWYDNLQILDINIKYTWWQSWCEVKLLVRQIIADLGQLVTVGVDCFSCICYYY